MGHLQALMQHKRKELPAMGDHRDLHGKDSIVLCRQLGNMRQISTGLLSLSCPRCEFAFSLPVSVMAMSTSQKCLVIGAHRGQHHIKKRNDVAGAPEGSFFEHVHLKNYVFWKWSSRGRRHRTEVLIGNCRAV